MWGIIQLMQKKEEIIHIIVLLYSQLAKYIMMRHIIFLLVAFTLASCTISNHEELRQSINRIIKDKNATVGVALIIDGEDTLTVNNDFHYPTQSTYKFPLALCVLDYMHKNNIALDHKIFIKAEELLPNTWSPIRLAYPEGNMEMSLADILEYTVSRSDNNGCDILFRFVGGTNVVDKYIRNLGFNDFAIAATEEEMHGPWEVQYTNWSTPYNAAGVLEAFRTKDILPREFHDFLWNIMAKSTTGKNKIKALLPEGTFVAHKSGSSYRNAEGLNAAENDMAIIELPDGKYYSLAVFVADSMEDEATNCKMIADISKAVYDYLN